MQRPAAILATFCSLILGGSAMAQGVEQPADPPAESTPEPESPTTEAPAEQSPAETDQPSAPPIDGVKESAGKLQDALDSEPAPAECGEFTCGITHGKVNCGECAADEQCRWDGINGTAGVCVPGTYGKKVEEAIEVAPLPIPEVPKAEAATTTWRSSGFDAFRGTSVSLRNVGSAISANKDAEPTWNPYYGLELNLAPRWSFLGKGFLAASFDLSRELTHSDSTTYEGELVYSDLALALGTSEIAALPFSIKLAGDLGITLPVSKYSRARTLRLSLRPGLSLSRTFPVLKGLRAGYSIRAAKNFHEFTTSQRDVPLIPQCRPELGDCARFSNTGVRNASWQLSQSVSLGIEFTSGFGLQASTAVITSFLYGWEKDDPRLSYQPQAPVQERYLVAYGLELYKEITPAISLALGLSTVNPQLAPDSTYYEPFVNRYSAIYFDLRLAPVALVSHSSPSE